MANNITIANFESAFLRGHRRFSKWKAKHEVAFTSPMTEMVLGMILARMSPEQRAQLREMNPEAYDAVMKKIAGG